jgi:hypothetical protein
MNVDPQKLFIGLMDFFSILLPGALLTDRLMDEAGPAVLGDRYSKLDGAQAWAAFLYANSLFGHPAFCAGLMSGRFLRLGTAPFVERTDHMRHPLGTGQHVADRGHRGAGPKKTAHYIIPSASCRREVIGAQTRQLRFCMMGCESHFVRYDPVAMRPASRLDADLPSLSHHLPQSSFGMGVICAACGERPQGAFGPRMALRRPA